MSYFYWLLPTILVAIGVASGRLNTSYAAALGFLTAIPIAIFTGPHAFTATDLTQASLRGTWIALVIAPYVIGGLLFWQVATAATASSHKRPAANALIDALAKRRHLFFACFLLGPFAESATGFGVGMLGTVILLRRFNIAPKHLMIFALLSQTLIPWGCMGSGTLLAAAYARISPTDLAIHALIPSALLMLVWLPLYWRTAESSGISANASEMLKEAAWLASGLLLLAGATMLLGLETAGLAVFGTLIVVRYISDSKPNLAMFVDAARHVMPYAVLITILLLIRLVPVFNDVFKTIASFSPYPDLPEFSPFIHAGTWLVAGALITARINGHISLRHELGVVWHTGRHAVCTIFLFSAMAEVLAKAGIASALAESMFDSLNVGAVIATPFISGAFGVLTNSGNAPNSLFMPSQITLAMQAGLSVPAVAALQHVSGTAMGIFSPVRMSIAAGLANGHGHEKSVYRALMWPAIAAVSILVLTAAMVIL